MVQRKPWMITINFNDIQFDSRKMEGEGMDLTSEFHHLPSLIVEGSITGGETGASSADLIAYLVRELVLEVS